MRSTLHSIPLNIALLSLGLLCSAAFFLISSTGDLRPHIALFLSLFGLAFACYSLAIFVISRTAGKSSGKNPLAHIIFFALAMRVIMLTGDYPLLTDDIYRYVWDARVAAAGINPFTHPPQDDALAPLRDDDLFPKINHPHIPTIYPPLLQALFRLAALFSEQIIAMRILFVLFDLATLFLLILLLRTHARPLEYSLIYAWNPLLIIETAGSGHVDTAGVFLLVLAFLLLRYRRTMAGTAALTMATLTKFVPAILLPWMLKNRPARTRYSGIAVFLLLIILAYLPYLSAGDRLFAALGTYSSKWEFNASLFKLIYLPVHALLPDAAVRIFAAIKGLTANDATLVTFRVDLALLISKAIAGSIFAGVYYILWKREKSGDGEEREKIWLLLFGFLCMLSPTLHPWYLIWLLPVLSLYPDRAWILLTGTIMLSYTVVGRYYFEGIWQENTLVRLLIFVPFYAMLVYEHRSWLRAVLLKKIRTRDK